MELRVDNGYTTRHFHPMLERLRDDYAFSRAAVYQTSPHWAPIFEPDATQMSGIGDAAIKINQAVPGYFDKDSLETLTGVRAGAEAGNDTTGTEE